MRRLLSDHVLAERLGALEDALAQIWLDDDGPARVALAASRLLPGTVGLFYVRDPDGSFGPVGHTALGAPNSRWSDWPVPDVTARLAPLVSYRMNGRDPFANRVANLTTVMPDAEHRRAFQQLIEPAGLESQLRAVFYRGSTMRAWFGVLGARGDGEFSDAEANVLTRALPAVRDAVRAAEITRYGRAEPTALQGILEAVGPPVWILVRGGSVAHANAAARGLGRDARAAAARAATRREGDPRFAVSRVMIGGEPVAVVIGRALVSGPPLPPSLARVATLAATGASDKEIAATLGVSVVTVRTYMRRIYARLGVRSRARLARIWLASNASSSRERL
jgi:DNA-binding CsgD family transcriptional regulator